MFPIGTETTERPQTERVGQTTDRQANRQSTYESIIVLSSDPWFFLSMRTGTLLINTNIE